MKPPISTLLLLAVLWFGCAEPAHSAVVFRAGEKVKARAPGEEEMSGNAQQLFSNAQDAERGGNYKGAIKIYRTLVRRHPRDTLAAGSVFRMAQLQEQIHDYLNAARSYAVLTEKFPKSERFNEAIESQFRIGEMYLAGRKKKILGIPVKASMDEAADIFSSIVRNAPYGKLTARAQFGIGRAREKQGSNEAALAAYQAVVEKFPDDPLAADAQYQIGYIWSKVTRSGSYDPAAASKAKTGFEDFLFRHPRSEKATQARENLQGLEHKQTSTSFEIAKYYDKQKAYRAAAIYYNETIRQQPASVEGERAKKRLGELRAKVGEAALQPPAVTAAAANRKKKTTAPPQGESGGPAMRASPNDIAPLPPPDLDLSLPPPASLLPDPTSAPGSSSTDTSASPTPAPSPEATASPE
ncbi:MAG: outer membrane protein assembly factor BamD [Verrucomicrobiota bacterium]